MRLTTINSMKLRPGRVLVYNVEATRDAAGPPISFDQRAHCARGPRPGSWMAVSFDLPQPATRTQIAQAYHRLIARHGTMRTAVHNPDAPTLLNIDISPGQWHAEAPEDARDVLSKLFDERCQPFATPSHQLTVVDHAGGDTLTDATIILAFDHTHTDAWSLLVTLRDFCALLAGEELPPTLSFGEHSQQLARRSAAPKHVVRRWREHLAAGMPTFPGDLGNISIARPQVVEVFDIFSAEGLARFDFAAQTGGMTNLALLVQAMSRVAPVRAVFPIHSRKQPHTQAGTWENAMGWFITNSVLTYAQGQDVTAAIRETIELGSYPLAPIMDEFPTVPGMFAISWLDNRKLPITPDAQLHPQHISANFHTDSVMAWFVTNFDGMHMRVRYPDTPQARESVGRWCAGVVGELSAEIYRCSHTSLVTK